MLPRFLYSSVGYFMFTSIVDRWRVLDTPFWYTKAVIACGGGCWGILSLCQKLVPLWFPSIS